MYSEMVQWIDYKHLNNKQQKKVNWATFDTKSMQNNISIGRAKIIWQMIARIFLLWLHCNSVRTFNNPDVFHFPISNVKSSRGK